MKKGNVIFVTGVPVAGKTAVGRALAKRLGCTFVDIDDDLRRLLPPVDSTVNTHSGVNTFLADAGYQMLYTIAETWATLQSGTVILTLPMIRSCRQVWLQDFCAKYPNVVILVITMNDDSDEKVSVRLAARKAAGYTGDVNTIAEYRRVKSTAVPMPLEHKVVDTSVGSIDDCVREAMEYLGP